MAAHRIYAVETDADGAVARYRRWKPLLEAVRHPHVRAILDVGLTVDRRLYVASEHVVGSTLAMSEIVTTLRPDDRRAIGEQLIDAVDAIHAAGLAHLALVPSRVKFSTTNGRRPSCSALVRDWWSMAPR